MSEQKDPYWRAGIICSFVGHAVLLLLISLRIDSSFDFDKPIVYSVTIEGGKKLGGISQVPKGKQKTPVAPPKKVKTAPPKQKEAPKVETKKKEEPKKKKVEPKKTDAEVSLAKKKKTEPKKEKPKPPPPKKKTSTPKKTKQQSLAEINKKLQQAVQRYSGESTNAGGQGFGAGALGGKGMGGGQKRPPEFFVYMKTLENYIKSGWRWHNTSTDLEARVCFAISEQGILSRINLCGPSGNREYDDSVMRAIYKANPVPAPPQSVYHYFREVRMNFTPND